MERENHRGVFWLIDDKLLAVRYNACAVDGLAKSGNNYNHKLLWDYVKPQGCRKPFDYYPRGRVEIDNKGRNVIYMNINIDETYLPEIIRIFGLPDNPRIHYDGSEHYKSHYDR